MNVIGSRPDGWWHDRDRAARRLVERLQQLTDACGDEITVVFDGRALPDLPEGPHGPVTVWYAARSGANAADDRIVQVVAEDPDSAALEVITADRTLRARVARLGAAVSGPRPLLDELDRIDRDGAGPER